jgi:dTDP-L-rhamnose 4-epimerase
VSDLAWALARAVDPRLTPVTTGRWRLGDVRHIVASPVRVAETLGFVAEVEFDAGIAEFARAPQRAGG